MCRRNPPAMASPPTSESLLLHRVPVDIPAGPAENSIKVRDFFISMDVDIAVSGFAPGTDRAGVRTVRDNLAYVQDGSRKRLDAGLSVEEAIRDISLGEYSAGSAAERIVIDVNQFRRRFRVNRRRCYSFNSIERLVPMVMELRRT